MDKIKKNKAYYEQKFVDYICKIGVKTRCEINEGINTYYCFWLSDGQQRYWTNISPENLNKIRESIKIEAENRI